MKRLVGEKILKYNLLIQIVLYGIFKKNNEKNSKITKKKLMSKMRKSLTIFF